MALVGIELETLVSEPDALTTRPPHIDKTSKKPRRIQGDKAAGRQKLTEILVVYKL